MIVIQIVFCTLISSVLYLFLHKKTRISVKYVFIDNLVIILTTYSIAFLISSRSLLFFPLNVILIFAGIYSLTMLRFWRTPRRKVKASSNEIVSPADGRVIYIKTLNVDESPFSLKGKVISKLDELTKTELLQTPCILIGINMTPFDVHKNCAPISGKIILNKHTNGKYLSLKDNNAIIENERNTYVIKNDSMSVGVIQIASKRVRRIDSYVSEGQEIKQGGWLGMIRFGSQVDIILPQSVKIGVKLDQQIYACQTIIGKTE